MTLRRVKIVVTVEEAWEISASLFDVGKKQLGSEITRQIENAVAYHQAEEAWEIFASLFDVGKKQLGSEIPRQIENAVAYHQAEEAERKRLDALRLARAEGHVLTKRQAQALAAVRAGQGPYAVWDTDWGTPRWRRGRSMGGAVARMIETLINEGLLDRTRKITEPGRIRLEEWEDKHGKVGP